MREGSSRLARPAVTMRLLSLVFANKGGRDVLSSSQSPSLDRVGQNGRENAAVFHGDFVLHPLRHTILTRLRKSGWMPSPSSDRGARSIVAPQRYIQSRRHGSKSLKGP